MSLFAEALEFVGVAETGIGLTLLLMVLYWRKITMILGVIGAKVTVLVFSLGLLGLLAITGVVDVNPGVAVDLAKSLFEFAKTLWELFG